MFTKHTFEHMLHHHRGQCLQLCLGLVESPSYIFSVVFLFTSCPYEVSRDKSKMEVLSVFVISGFWLELYADHRLRRGNDKLLSKEKCEGGAVPGYCQRGTVLCYCTSFHWQVCFWRDRTGLKNGGGGELVWHCYPWQPWLRQDVVSTIALVMITLWIFLPTCVRMVLCAGCGQLRGFSAVWNTDKQADENLVFVNKGNENCKFTVYSCKGSSWQHGVINLSAIWCVSCSTYINTVGLHEQRQHYLSSFICVPFVRSTRSDVVQRMHIWGYNADLLSLKSASLKQIPNSECAVFSSSLS